MKYRFMRIGNTYVYEDIPNKTTIEIKGNEMVSYAHMLEERMNIPQSDIDCIEGMKKAMAEMISNVEDVCSIGDYKYIVGSAEKWI